MNVFCSIEKILHEKFLQAKFLLNSLALQSPDFGDQHLQGISWQIEQSNLALLRIQILIFADIFHPIR